MFIFLKKCKTFVVSFIFSIIVLPAFSYDRQAEIISHYLRGALYVYLGNYRKGLDNLKVVKRLDPKSLFIRLKLSSLGIRLGDIKYAERELQQAKRLFPERIEPITSLVLLYSYAQEEAKLEKEYETFLKKAQSLQPENIEIYQQLGQFYIQKKYFQKAIETYKNILKLNPKNLDSIFWLGYLYDEIGRRSEAIKILKKGLQIDSHYHPILNSLGYLYVEEDINLKEAESLIKQALKYEPENGAYLDSLGWLYFKRKEYSRAKEYLEKALSRLKDPVIYEHLCEVYLKMHNKKKAVDILKEGIENFPHNEKLKKKLKNLSPLRSKKRKDVYERKSK